MNNFKTICVSLILLLVLGIASINGQTKKKHSPKPLATPMPTLTGAEIISRADDYEDPNAAQPVQKNTAEKSDCYEHEDPRSLESRR